MKSAALFTTFFAGIFAIFSHFRGVENGVTLMINGVEFQ